MLPINYVPAQNRTSYCIIKYANEGSSLDEQKPQLDFPKRRHILSRPLNKKSVGLKRSPKPEINL
jgi:hypothetical protein